jgi:putative DNA primase/helicase
VICCRTEPLNWLGARPRTLLDWPGGYLMNALKNRNNVIKHFEAQARGATFGRSDDAVTVDLVRGDSVKIEPVNWLWKNTLPHGMLTILAGAPGCGKTTIAISLGATITSGGNWPDKTACQFDGDVVIWSGEDTEGILASRFLASGAHMQRVHFVGDLKGGRKMSFDPSKDMELLETTLASLELPRLLILDPIVSVIDGDSYKATEVRRGLQPVVDLASRIGCAVLGITHFSKGTAGRDVVERLNGSVAFGAVARIVLVAAKVQNSENPEECKRIFMRAKSNIGPDDGGFEYELNRIELGQDIEGQRVIWGQRIEGSARDALAEGEPQNNDEGATSDVQRLVFDLLSSGPVSAKVMEADIRGAGYSKQQADRAARKLGVIRAKVGMKGGWTWELPKVVKPSEGVTEEHEETVDISENLMKPSHEGIASNQVKPSYSSVPSVMPSGEDSEAF